MSFTKLLLSALFLPRAEYAKLAEEFYRTHAEEIFNYGGERGGKRNLENRF